MGEVYCARDTRLDRTVAVKILPSHLSENPEAKQRFDREARAISSLSHPNICTLYDVGHEDGIDYLVMEFLEGETLADRLRKGPLTTQPLLKWGIDICAGLEKAHKTGVIHRDLKPGNIMLTKTGAKLLDFGLAKATLAQAPPVSNLTVSGPSPGAPLTAQGVVLGTFQYMSPEQVEGRDADARSDIFALGAVLYEMATGKRAFQGNTTSSVIAAVLERDPPPVSTVQPMSPPALDWVVKTCLAKDPDERFQNVHDVKLQLNSIAEGGSQAGVPMPVASRRKNREKLMLSLIGALAILAGALALRSYLHPRTLQAGPVLAFIPPPPDTHFLAFGFGSGPAVVSPDETKLAFTAIDQNGLIKLWTRSLKASDAAAITGTDGAAAPFWSPDGRSLGFFAGSKLKTVDLNGGNLQILADSSSPEPAAWAPDGTILFRPASNSGLFRVSATGGKAVPFAVLGGSDVGDNSPTILPDGKHVLVAVIDEKQNRRVELRSLASAETKVVLEDAAHPAYADGFLFFIRNQKIFAQRFDPGSGKVSGTATPVADADWYSVAGPSVLSFQASSREARLQWFDLNGNSLGTIGQIAFYLSPKIAPNGKQILFLEGDPQYEEARDFWSLPVAGGVSTRMTFSPGEKYWSAWSPDGKYIAYGLTSKGKASIVRKPSDGSDGEETLLSAGPEVGVTQVVDWSPDGRYLSYDAFDIKKGRRGNWTLPLFGDRKPFAPAPIAAGDQYDGNFSPDGHWLAYFSDETGQPEVYVVSFPGPHGGKYQISHGGGWLVRWDKKGDLFYMSIGNQLMKAELSLDAQSLQVKSLRRLFQMNLLDTTAPLFDVTADGQHILAVTPARAESSSISLLLNWPALLNK
ncbi:MAG: eukaryotic-like serine/threonine-protein kinase [Acidobacteriaceae bacterium]|jgi:serine/threonine protein kinase